MIEYEGKEYNRRPQSNRQYVRALWINIKGGHGAERRQLRAKLRLDENKIISCSKPVEEDKPASLDLSFVLKGRQEEQIIRYWGLLGKGPLTPEWKRFRREHADEITDFILHRT